MIVFSSYRDCLLLLVKSKGSAEGEVYKTYAENKKLSRVVRELACSSNRLIAIFRYNYNPN